MMDLVLVPINLDSHWSLVVILRPGLLLVSTQHTHTVFDNASISHSLILNISQWISCERIY